MDFRLKRACKDCPFRTSCPPGWLGRSRAVEIAGYLFGRFGKTFPCHKTTSAGRPNSRTKQAHCAGALALMQNEGAPNQWAQIAQRLGLYRPVDIDRDGVFGTVNEFVDHHSEPT